MNTLSEAQKSQATVQSAEVAPIELSQVNAASIPPRGVPKSSDEFRDIPSNSASEVSQTTDTKPPYRKTVPGTFAQKLSPEQRSQVFEWLADHTYDEVVELVGAEPPEGFGIKVGKTTICRFYKANFNGIDKLRQDRLEHRAMESLQRVDSHDYRAVVRDAYTQLLLERLWELLSRPVQSADELKKLTVIAEKMKSLDRDKEIIEGIKAERSEAEINKILAPFRTRPTST